MLCKFLSVLVTIVAIFSITGCDTSESVIYIHEPSEIFYKNFDINHKKSNSFIDNDIMFTVSVKEADFDLYWIWLSFYTEKQVASINVKQAQIKGNGFIKQIVLEQEFLINKATERDSKVYDLRNIDIKLIELSADELIKFVDDENIFNIEITYILDGQTKKTNFEIKKIIEKRVIYPT